MYDETEFSRVRVVKEHYRRLKVSEVWEWIHRWEF